MTGVYRKRERGAALLSILMIVAVMSIAALAAVESLGRSVALARLSDERSQILWAAHSAEAVASQSVLQVETLGRQAFGKPAVFPLERGVIVAALSDDSNCFNLNSLGGDAGGPAAHDIYKRLLVHSGILPGDAQRLADTAADWIDGDEETRAYGAEADTYRRRPVPYRTSNRLMENISELRAVEGYEPGILKRISENICVRPDTNQPALNIETLKHSNAPLLAALLSEVLTLEEAEVIIRGRPVSGWGSVGAFLGLDTISQIAPESLNEAILSVRSGYVRLDADISVGSAREKIALIYKTDTPGSAILVERRMGAF